LPLGPAQRAPLAAVEGRGRGKPGNPSNKHQFHPLGHPSQLAPCALRLASPLPASRPPNAHQFGRTGGCRSGGGAAVAAD